MCEFITLLEEAVSRDTAQQSLEQQLQDTRVAIDERQHRVDLDMCQLDVFADKHSEVPELDRIVDRHKHEVRSLETEMEDLFERRDLLDRRLKQATEVQAQVLQVMYKRSQA